MPKRIAITIAGAVSLGAYEAGVMYEVLEALRQHNEWADAQDKNQRIEIDVLTGASAGGMTAAITARALLFAGDMLKDPYGNPFYLAWVKQIDIAGLLNRDANEDVTCSVLSSDCVIRISKDQLGPPTPPTDAHPALSSSGKLSLGLALSNLNGVDYCRTSMSERPLIYTEFQDQKIVHLDRASGYQANVWETVRASAVACGAFPIAFRTEELVRNISDYLTNPFLCKESWSGKSSASFCYTDGGVFYNEPLGMAMNLVQELPGGHLQGASRAYLFIAPKPKGSDMQGGIQAKDANFKVVAGSLMGAVLGQAEFHDWATAESFNDELQLLDKRADQLRDLFANHRLDPDQTKVISDALLTALFTKHAVFDGAALDDARAQLRQQYQAEWTSLAQTATATAEAWLDAVLVLEYAAGLHEKEEMYIYDFVADPTQLAGGGLFAFVGFFDERYRKHDYEYGRSVAQKMLTTYASEDTVFQGLHWSPGPVGAIDSSLNSVQMKDVDVKVRQQVFSQLLSSANSLLREMGLNALECWGAKKFFVEKQLKRLLAL